MTTCLRTPLAEYHTRRILSNLVSPACLPTVLRKVLFPVPVVILQLSGYVWDDEQGDNRADHSKT